MLGVTGRCWSPIRRTGVAWAGWPALPGWWSAPSGPYARHGLPLVRACAAAGTCYADLTGEPKFVRDSIDGCSDCRRSPVRRSCTPVVSTPCRPISGCRCWPTGCPRTAPVNWSRPRWWWSRSSGGISGGTIDSMRAGIDDAGRSGAGRRLADPYLFSPDREAEPDLGRQSTRSSCSGWTTAAGWRPFVMSSYNSRVVRRSNALQGHRYGREPAVPGGGPDRRIAARGCRRGRRRGGQRCPRGGPVQPVTRPLLDRVLPAPGEGPSEKARRNGAFQAGDPWRDARPAPDTPPSSRRRATRAIRRRR